MTSKIGFDDLPLRKDGPKGNAWGRFGPEDQLGTLNLITPDTVKQAAEEIKEGVRISTDWPLGSMSPPCFGRQALEHTILHKPPRTVNDDILCLNTQSSSQWDGFRHFGYQQEKVYYDGLTQEEVHTTTRNGIDAWVEKGGIVGRGVLIDYAAWCESNSQAIGHFSTTSIPLSTILSVAASQNTTFRPGDILFIRTGWTTAYKALPATERANLASRNPPSAIGVESSPETLRWIWEQGFAAVAGDQPAFEAWPCQREEFKLHEWLLAGWGCPIGELFDLARLGEECKRRKRYTFFFSSVPLKVPGGVASPPNGVAIF